jgi:YidC/Oxa1 family membrane protein insertase
MFHTYFYEPIYNLLAFILTIVPLHDVGMAIILVTLLVKILLLPLNLSALRSQYMMKRIEPDMEKIKKLQKTDPQTASKQMVALYREQKINPFASLFVVIIQIPIFFALYFVFSEGLKADPESLYSFITFPETIHNFAFGLFDVTEKNLVLAILAGISSYLLARRQAESMHIERKEGEEETFQHHFMKSMKIQVLYVIPVVVAFSAAILPSALALYWFVSNVVGYGQDVYMKRKLAHLKIHHIK